VLDAALVRLAHQAGPIPICPCRRPTGKTEAISRPDSCSVTAGREVEPLRMRTADIGRLAPTILQAPHPGRQLNHPRQRRIVGTLHRAPPSVHLPATPPTSILYLLSSRLSSDNPSRSGPGPTAPIPVIPCHVCPFCWQPLWSGRAFPPGRRDCRGAFVMRPLSRGIRDAPSSSTSGPSFPQPPPSRSSPAPSAPSAGSHSCRGAPFLPDATIAGGAVGPAFAGHS
jgi:hypothetical protein